jgi:hypothetical protein
VELRSQKCSSEDKFSADVMHVGGWMKSIPEDVVIRVGYNNAGRRIVGCAGAVCEPEGERLHIALWIDKLWHKLPLRLTRVI